LLVEECEQETDASIERRKFNDLHLAKHP